MKNYIQVTTRYLKVQKKRTALTVLGIILSVALITGIGTILESLQDKMVRDAIKDNGSYHILFQQVAAGKVNVLRKHTGVEGSGVTKTEGYAVIGRFTDSNPTADGPSTPPDDVGKPTSYNQYLNIMSYSTGAMGLLPTELSEGRLPQVEGEIVLDGWAASKLPDKPGIGSKISLDTGVLKSAAGTPIQSRNFTPGEEQYEKTGHKDFTIVGFLKPSYYYTGLNMATGITWLDDGKLLPEGGYQVYVKVRDFKHALDLAGSMAGDAGLDPQGVKNGSIRTNERVLRLYGESVNETLGSTFMLLASFVIIVVVVCMIAVIYNAFNISVLERVSQFGLLRCVGASSGQIRKIVLREALLLSAVGIPIGVLCGTLAMKVLFSVIGSISPQLPFNDLKVVISPQIVLASIILGLAAVLLSAYGPALHAARIAPMDALRNTGSYKKESFKKIKKSRLARLFFGVEGWIAWKNLRRNRKRFVVTVFSMVISIVLYIVFTSIFTFAFKSEAISDKKPSDYIVYKNNRDFITKAEYNTVLAIPGVGEVTGQSTADILAWIPENRLNDRYKELRTEQIKDKANGRVKIGNSSLIAYGGKVLQKFGSSLRSGKIDTAAMDRENGVIVLNTTILTEPGTGKSIFTSVTNYKPGDELELSLDSSQRSGTGGSNNLDKPLKKVKVLAVTETADVGNEYTFGGGVTLITTENVYRNITGNQELSSLYVDLKPGADQKNVSEQFESFAQNNPGIYYTDYASMAENQANTIVIMGIFIFGFIAVITLIGSINIVNTISTNLILRTKELSMMKAVGMTKNSIKKMVCLESIFHGIIAAIIGGAAGTLLSYLFYVNVIRLREFEWGIPWDSILIAGAGAVIIALFAGILPLRRINKGIIIDNIRTEE